MTLQFSCGFAIHTKTGSMCWVIRFLFWFIKKTAWFLRRFFMVFFNSNAVFTTFERWMNFRCGVGRFFCDLLVKFRIVFVRQRKEIHFCRLWNQSNLIYSCRQLRLFWLVFRFQILGSIAKVWKVPWLSCQKIKINW